MNYCCRGLISIFLLPSIFAASSKVEAFPYGSPASTSYWAYSGKSAAASKPYALTDSPLPDFPKRPELDAEAYPDCREEYRAKSGVRAQVSAIDRCTRQIDAFYQSKMLTYREAMVGYQQQLSALFMDKVRSDPRVSPAARQQYYRLMMGEHAASAPGGAHLSGYRMIEGRYKADRAYLADRYCFNTGCNGYLVPVEFAAPAERRKSIRLGLGTEVVVAASGKAQSKTRCGGRRTTGQVVGGLVGGLAGGLAGLDGVGTAVSGLVGAAVAGEIGCQLNDEEREAAADATIEVTRKEKVGATAKWISPTREGVSGSSTITELGTQPNGTRCLSITDIAIIDGEETRVMRQMCRSKPGEPYTIAPEPGVAFTPPGD